MFNPLYLDFYGSEPSDLDASIDEQSEEFETFGSDRRHSIILRTKLSVRVHACIEKLYNSKGRDLRRALFSLKQIFQDDKELVHEFVKRDGLTCLVKVFSIFRFFYLTIFKQFDYFQGYVSKLGKQENSLKHLENNLIVCEILD